MLKQRMQRFGKSTMNSYMFGIYFMYVCMYVCMYKAKNALDVTVINPKLDTLHPKLDEA